MKGSSATEAKRGADEALRKAQQSPVRIDKVHALHTQCLDQAIAEGMEDLKAGKVSSVYKTSSRLRRLVALAVT